MPISPCVSTSRTDASRRLSPSLRAHIPSPQALLALWAFVFLAGCKRPGQEDESFTAPTLTAEGSYLVDSLAPLEATTSKCLSYADSCLVLRSETANRIYLFNPYTRRSRWMLVGETERIYAQANKGRVAWLDRKGRRLGLTAQGDTAMPLPRSHYVDDYLVGDGGHNLFFMDWGPSGSGSLVVSEVRSGKDFMPIRRLNLETMRTDTLPIPVVDREALRHTYNRSRTLNGNNRGLLLQTYAHSDTITLIDVPGNRYRQVALPLDAGLFYRSMDPERMVKDAEYVRMLVSNSLFVANSSFAADGRQFTVVAGMPEKANHVTDYQIIQLDTSLTDAYKGVISDSAGRTPFMHFLMGDKLYAQRQSSSQPDGYGRFFFEAYPLRTRGRHFMLKPGPWKPIPAKAGQQLAGR